MKEADLYEEVRTLVKMFPQFKKFKTGKKIPTTGLIPNKKEVTIDLDEYSIPFGDIMCDYMSHINKRWWKRDKNHKEVTRTYILVLNMVLTIKVNI